jgi:nucleotide-binding universal stress UspA family protein
MRRFKNILFVLEGGLDNDAALKRAADLAERNGAALTLVHALEVTPGHEGIEPGWARLTSEWRGQLEAVAAPIAERGIEVTTEVVTGIPFREIIALVQRRGLDLVVKAATKPGGPRGLLFGSLDLHLMRKCPAPVWIHQARAEDAGYGRIMASVDVGDTSHVGRAMTRFILDLATSLGQLDDSDVHVVHAWSSTGERMARASRRGLLPLEEIQREAEAEAVERQTLFRDAVAPYLELPVRLQLHLLHGDPREVLPLFARDREVDLIVMGTLARTGVPGFFMGNTSEDVLRQVDASVLTLKPEGFVSPVVASA